VMKAPAPKHKAPNVRLKSKANIVLMITAGSP
jgi:hypothetical protein